MRIRSIATCLVLAVSMCAAEETLSMDSQFLKIGHQGANGYLPGNTLAAFSRALELGADMVELDVHLSRDGRLMVIHDESVDRTTNGSGIVGEMTLAELQQLDAGGGEKIPTLDQVLKLVAGRCAVNVELKGPGTAGPVAVQLVEFVREKGVPWENFTVSSFDHAQLAQLQEIEPRIRRAPLFGADLPPDFIRIAHKLEAWSVNLNRVSVTAGLVEQIHRAGLRVLVYTVNAPEDIARLKDLGVDGIFSDYPDRLR